MSQKRKTAQPATIDTARELTKMVRAFAERMYQRNAELNGGIMAFLDEQVAEIDRLEAQLGGLVKPLPPDLLEL